MRGHKAHLEEVLLPRKTERHGKEDSRQVPSASTSVEKVNQLASRKVQQIVNFDSTVVLAESTSANGCRLIFRSIFPLLLLISLKKLANLVSLLELPNVFVRPWSRQPPPSTSSNFAVCTSHSPF